MEVQAKVSVDGKDIFGDVSFTLEGEETSMSFLCRRVSPCEWKVMKQWFGNVEVTPPDYDYLSHMQLPSLTAALEEKYQELTALEQTE